MNKRWDVLGIGSSAVDDILFVDHYPLADEKMPILSKQRQGGGQTATALVAAARQGARTAFCGRLGEDELSRFTRETLEAEQVDCSTVLRVPGSQPYHAFIIVDSILRSRTILYSTDNVFEPDIENIPTEWFTQTRVVFIDQNIPRAALWAARQAAQCNIPIVADIEKTNAPELVPLLDTIDHLIVGLNFARWFCGEDNFLKMLMKLKRPQQKALILTAGEQGYWLCEPDKEILHFPAFPTQVVDTTGCGDVFHGSYAAAIARGEPIQRAAQIANISAGIKAGQAGGRPGIPDLPTVLHFL